MNKSTRTKLTTAVEQILQLKGLIGSQELQVDGLKKIVADICNANPDAFTEGVLTIDGVGAVKIVQNKPKLVYIATGEPLEPADKLILISRIGDAFQKIEIDMVGVRDSVRMGDKVVVKNLDKLGVMLIQDSRYDVKKA